MPAKQPRRRYTIGVLPTWQVYTGTLNTLLHPILRGITIAAQQQGCNLLIACGVAPPHVPDLRPAWPLLAAEVDFAPVGDWNTDGLIVIAGPPPEDVKARHIQQMIAAGHPVVFAETADRASSVGLDNAGGIRQALEHLKQHGRTPIAFIAGLTGGIGDSLERLNAFYDESEALGLQVERRLMADGQFTTPGGFQAMQQILATGLPFSAVLACNDESAIGAIQALQAAGKRVPQDAAVIGFDNRFEARTHNLTTVYQPAFEIGQQALRLILRRLAGEAGAATVIRTPARLVIRQSCGCRQEERDLTPQPPSLKGKGEKTDMPTGAEGKGEEKDTPGGVEGKRGEKEVFIRKMSAAVFAEMGQSSPEAIEEQCRRLVEALLEGVAQKTAQPFLATLQDLLEQTTQLQEDANAWQCAISALFRGQPWLVKAAASTAGETPPPILAWLDQGRVLISDCARQQVLQHLTGQEIFTQQLSWMSAHLGEVVETVQIQPIVDEYLPGLGIRQARLFFYEAEGDNPVAWTYSPSSSAAVANLFRFPTHQFPPPGLYPPDEPFQLALLPIKAPAQASRKPAPEEEPPIQVPRGFVAFDAANLAPCVAVVRQIDSTLESIRLHHEASEGRRLAEEANRMKSRFLSTVSHELRTPLNLIVGLSEMQMKDPAVDARQTMQRIHTSAQHLSRLIRDVLDLASSDAGQLRLSSEPLDLAETLHMAASLGEQLAGEKGLEWQTDIPAGLPKVWGDRLRLQQIALNLVSNAVKFTSRGRVMLQVQNEGRQVRVAVQDSGLGIPPEEQAWIFDEFRQSERTTARGYGGLGLGLAICKRLVELHGGEIGVQSSGEEGAGSTFYFTLPALERAEAIAAPGENILFLAKRAGLGQALHERLQRAGFALQERVIDANSNWLPQILTTPPQAVLLDAQTAAEQGWEILKALKGSPSTGDIPVMFYALDPERDSGAVFSLDYLTKPVGSQELFQALARQGWNIRAAAQDKTILIVDDEPETLEMNARMLQTQTPGCRLLKARNGREALEALRAARIDLMLLDLMMPEVDGFEVLAQLRAIPNAAETAVIVLTSKTLTEADMARLNQGVAAVMSKGFYSTAEMAAHTEAALNNQRRLNSEARRMARKAMAYIHEHYTEELTRQSLASHVGASGGHLERCFHQETGVSLMAYLNRYRVHRAKMLLTGSDQSITAIALVVGFSDSNYFSRVFRQETGLSPLAYRRNPPA